MVENFEKLPKEELERIKRDYKNFLERATGTEIEKKIDVYYHYYSPEGFKKKYLKKHQKLTDQQAEKIYFKARFDQVKYITRPTFLIYQKELAGKLKNFRNSSNWGRFLEMSYEDYEDRAKKRELFCDVSKELILLQSGSCPNCAGELKWVKELTSGGLSFYGEANGNGYFGFDSDFKIRKYTKIKLPSREELRNRKHYANFFNQAINELNSQNARKDIYG